jgi:hypothetical protein
MSASAVSCVCGWLMAYQPNRKVMKNNEMAINININNGINNEKRNGIMAISIMNNIMASIIVIQCQ